MSVGMAPSIAGGLSITAECKGGSCLPDGNGSGNGSGGSGSACCNGSGGSGGGPGTPGGGVPRPLGMPVKRPGTGGGNGNGGDGGGGGGRPTDPPPPACCKPEECKCVHGACPPPPPSSGPYSRTPECVSVDPWGSPGEQVIGLLITCGDTGESQASRCNANLLYVNTADWVHFSAVGGPGVGCNSGEPHEYSGGVGSADQEVVVATIFVERLDWP